MHASIAYTGPVRAYRYLCISDAWMAVISTGAADDPRVGWVGL